MKLNENFQKNEKLLFYILLGTYLIDALTLFIIFLSNGDIPEWLFLFVLPLGLYYIIIFFVFIYRVYTFYKSDHEAGDEIWRSILGLLLSVIGLLFTFFNLAIILVANIW